jgi:NAD(P)-dependent dehydrogenase (short-subunit alcohol dehydrogenase family)
LSGTHLVTGGASGLGLAIADAIAQAGGTTVILDRQAVDRPYESHTVDVSDRAMLTNCVRTAAKRNGDLASVVANAGVDACGPLDGVDADEWERVIRINLIGIASLVRAALPFIVENRGRIVTVASTLGLRALGDASAYCASKFGVVGFTRALSAELAGRAGVTLLLPGGMRTSFFDGRDPKYQPPPDAPLNPPENVARAVVFALSQPPGCDVREMLVCPWGESSWP